DHHLVRHAPRLEADRPVRADLHRAVDKDVVARGLPAAVGALEGGEDAPPRGCVHREMVGRVAEDLGVEKEGGPVEEAGSSVEVAGPDGELVGVDAVADPDRAAAGPEAPGALVDPLDRYAHSSIVRGGELLDVPGELADQVAAGGPHREEELQGVGRGEQGL